MGKKNVASSQICIFVNALAGIPRLNVIPYEIGKYIAELMGLNERLLAFPIFRDLVRDVRIQKIQFVLSTCTYNAMPNMFHNVHDNKSVFGKL